MTKDEFLTMLNGELEQLEKEYSDVARRVDYFRETKNDKEWQESSFRLTMINQKLQVIRSLVGLPAYARIQAMSDVEIDAYKKEKIAELELKAEELKAREEQAKAELVQLKAQQEELIKQFGSLSGRAREEAIYKGQQLQVEISRYTLDGQFGVFGSLRKELQEVREMQEQIKSKTSEEIKADLSANIGKNKTFSDVMKLDSELAPQTEFLASVASDPEKAQQMANLLTYYKRISDEQKKVKGELFLLGRTLPRELERRLAKCNYCDLQKKEVSDPDKLAELVEEFEESFGQAKATFMEQFTMPKLHRLVGRENYVNDEEVDMEFLQMHSDKLGTGELKFLESIVLQRDGLSKKFFKTKKVKEQIEDLNDQIKRYQSKVYKEIIGWYQSQSKDVLGLDREISFFSLSDLKNSLEISVQDIGRSQDAISKLKETLKVTKDNMEKQKQYYEEIKIETSQKIRSLAGGKYMGDTAIPNSIPFLSDVREINLDKIAFADYAAYQHDVVNRVQQEAQNQADTMEAELSGMTTQQLLEMRKQALAEKSMEQPVQEVSSVMKK